MRISVHAQFAGILLLVALALANCGGATCSQRVNTSVGTEGVGPVSVTTDHSVYAPGEGIHATITNHLQQTIVVNNYDFTAYCPYFVLQMRAGNDWQNMFACQSSSGDTQPRNEPQRIAAGSSFASIVGLRSDLPAGTYRLWISSYQVFDAQGSSGTTESATFRVCACAVCTWMPTREFMGRAA